MIQYFYSLYSTIGYYKIRGLIPWSVQNILIACLIFKSNLYMLITLICASASLSSLVTTSLFSTSVTASVLQIDSFVLVFF